MMLLRRLLKAAPTTTRTGQNVFLTPARFKQSMTMQPAATQSTPSKPAHAVFGVFSHSQPTEFHHQLNAKRTQLLNIANELSRRLQNLKCPDLEKLHRDCWDLVLKIATCKTKQDIEAIEQSSEHHALAKSGWFNTERLQQMECTR